MREEFAEELKEQEDGLVDHYESIISKVREDMGTENRKSIEQVLQKHRKDIEQSQREGSERSELLQNRLDVLEGKVTEAEMVGKELKRQLAKATAQVILFFDGKIILYLGFIKLFIHQKEAVQQELLALQMERDSLLDRVSAVEIESEEALSKARLAAQQQLVQERNRLDDAHKLKLAEIQAQAAEKISAAEAASSMRVAQKEVELAAAVAALKAMEEDRGRLEAMFKTLVADRDAFHVLNFIHSGNFVNGHLFFIIRKPTRGSLLRFKRMSCRMAT